MKGVVKGPCFCVNNAKPQEHEGPFTNKSLPSVYLT